MQSPGAHPLTKENYRALGLSLLGVVMSGTILRSAGADATATGASDTIINLLRCACWLYDALRCELKSGRWQREQIAADAECLDHATDWASHRDVGVLWPGTGKK